MMTSRHAVAKDTLPASRPVSRRRGPTTLLPDPGKESPVNVRAHVPSQIATIPPDVTGLPTHNLKQIIIPSIRIATGPCSVIHG